MEVIRNIKLKHFKGFVAGTGQLTQGAIDASCVNITHHAKLSTDSAHMYISWETRSTAGQDKFICVKGMLSWHVGVWWTLCAVTSLVTIKFCIAL